MNKKVKKPYNTPSRTIDKKELKKAIKKNKSVKLDKNLINSNNISKSKMVKPKLKITSSKKNIKDNKKNLELTTRIRIDKDRIEDSETLDTSFLEGRRRKNTKSKQVKEKILKSKKNKVHDFDFGIIRNFILLLIIILGIIASIMLLSKNINNNQNKFFKNNNINKLKNKEEDKKNDNNKDNVIDDNYLFIGDFHTENFNFDNLDYHYVKESEKDLTTSKVLEDLNDKIYKYNPSVVFIQLGIVDLDQKKTNKEIADNIKKIIKGIKENRPYAKIYIESIYPINKNIEDYSNIISNKIDIDDIIEVNKLIKEVVDDTKVNYLDIFKVLSNDKKLREDFTKDGVEINNKAYDEILKEIDKIVG